MESKIKFRKARRISLQEREKGVIAQEKLPEKYRDHAIFAAFAPTIHPKYAAVVFVEPRAGDVCRMEEYEPEEDVLQSQHDLHRRGSGAPGNGDSPSGHVQRGGR